MKIGPWVIEVYRENRFETYTNGYATAKAAQAAAARAFKSFYHSRTVRVISDNQDDKFFYQKTFVPGKRARWETIERKEIEETCNENRPLGN
jgi:hypothetical protein